MQADDYVMCDDCKEKTKDRKALKLHRLPEVLLIMLKRTMYPSTEKDDRHITFPLEARPSSSETLHNSGKLPGNVRPRISSRPKTLLVWLSAPVSPL